MKFLTDLNLVVGIISAISSTLALLTDKIINIKWRLALVIPLFLWLTISILLQVRFRTDSSTDNAVLQVDDIPSSIYSYQGTDTYTTTYDTLFINNRGAAGTDYRLEFNSTKGYSTDIGLAFSFSQKQNLSTYKWLQFSIDFSADGMDCRVYLTDPDDRIIFVDLNGYNPGIERVILDDKRQVFKISLAENFSTIDLKEVTGVFFLTNTETGAENEKQYFVVQDVRFSND